jgi:hypothetical protein
MKILDQISELFSLKIKEIAKRSDERHLGDGFNLERLDRILQRIYLHDRMSDGDFKELQMLGFLKGARIKAKPFEVGQKVKYFDINTTVTGVKYVPELKCWHVQSVVNSNWIHERFYK